MMDRRQALGIIATTPLIGTVDFDQESMREPEGELDFMEQLAQDIRDGLDASAQHNACLIRQNRHPLQRIN